MTYKGWDLIFAIDTGIIFQSYLVGAKKGPRYIEFVKRRKLKDAVDEVKLLIDFWQGEIES